MKKIAGTVWVTSEEMREVDRIVVQEFGIPIASMMENAGRALATEARRMLGGNVDGKSILLLAGGGNNGGGGLVASKHLHNWGANMSVALGVDENRMKELPARQLRIVRRLGIEMKEAKADFAGNSLIIDALLGYGQTGNPKEPMATIIKRANDSGVPIVSLDIPSGLDPDIGTPRNPCIKAKVTLTLALPKTGLLATAASDYVGQLLVADISVPREVYTRFGQMKNLFSKGMIVAVRTNFQP